MVSAEKESIDYGVWVCIYPEALIREVSLASIDLPYINREERVALRALSHTDPRSFSLLREICLAYQ